MTTETKTRLVKFTCIVQVPEHTDNATVDVTVATALEVKGWEIMVMTVSDQEDE